MPVIVPEKITFAHWIALLSQDFPGAIIPRCLNEDRWKEYAWQVVRDPTFSKFDPPAPDAYAEPIGWIRAFSNAIY